MNVHHFVDDDQSYLAWVASNPEGYVINIQRSLNPTTARLHTAGCRTIQNSTRGGPWTGPYVKICAVSLVDLETWALQQVGAEIRSCGVCHPKRISTVPLKVVQETRQPLQKKRSPGPGSKSSDFDLNLDAGLRRLDVWSERRLQYNEKPETKVLKAAIGDAISSLQAKPGEILSAVFTSSKSDLVDAENVLLYNVGAARFTGVAREGLRFERVHQAPTRYQHHHRYELVPRSSPSEHWQRGETRVTAASLPIPVLREKPDEVWRAVRSRVVTAPMHSGPYGLLVTLTTPKAVRLAALVKPLLDGIISGLHAHDGTDLEILAARLAQRLGYPIEEIVRLLMDPREAVLGVRPLLRKRTDGGLHWNPADDECVTCTLLSKVSPQASGWLLDFELFAVAPR